MKTLTFRVRPHVLKYLRFHLGPTYSLSRADTIGLVLFEMLRRQLDDSKRAKSVETYKDEWLIDLSQFPAHKYGLRNLTDDTIYTFNNHIHKLIHAQLHGWVDQAMDDGHRQKDAILAFMARYDFVDGDVSYDALKKSYQRYLKDNPQVRQRRVRLSCRGELKQLQRQVEKLAVPLMVATGLPVRAVA